MKRSYLIALAAIFVTLAGIFAFEGSSRAGDERAHKVKVSLSVYGKHDSKVMVRWGRPDHNKHEFFPEWKVEQGQTSVKIFDLLEDESEFEIQTKGGERTGYNLVVEIEGKEAILCRFNAETDGSKEYKTTRFQNFGVVRTRRSSNVNDTGEGKLKVYFSGVANKGEIPMRKEKE
jgi:hypothetical protein